MIKILLPWDPRWEIVGRSDWYHLYIFPSYSYISQMFFSCLAQRNHPGGLGRMKVVFINYWLVQKAFGNNYLLPQNHSSTHVIQLTVKDTGYQPVVQKYGDHPAPSLRSFADHLLTSCESIYCSQSLLLLHKPVIVIFCLCYCP